MMQKARGLLFIVLIVVLSTSCSSQETVILPDTDVDKPSSLVCLVTDTQGINDRSFNATAWKGVTDAEGDLGVDGVLLQSDDDSYYEVNIATFLQEDCDLIITVGFLIGEQTAIAAEKNPDQSFAIVDYDFYNFSTEPPSDVTYNNVKELTFKSDEAAFLAGYVAAAVTKTGKVGTFGGVKIPTVTNFMDGFVLGAEYFNQQHDANVEIFGWDPFMGVGLFTNTFDDVFAGYDIAEQLIEEGVDIMMPVAGGVGLGAASAAMEYGDVNIIGVDTDWVVSSPEYTSITLTSVLKNMDVAVLNAIRQVSDGSFEGGLFVGTLANNGVGLAPFHDLDSLVSDELVTDLENIKAKIISDEIQTQP